MTHFTHHFRRNRSYSTHERWGVFAGLFLLTVVISASGWLLFGKPIVSAESLTISQIELSGDSLVVGSQAKGYVTISLMDKETDTPQPGVWVGLRIPNASMQTPDLTYFGWYSPEPERAFYQTDAQGQVKLPLKSQVAGLIAYEIFTGNPERANDTKYQSLDYSFEVEYTESDE